MGNTNKSALKLLFLPFLIGLIALGAYKYDTNTSVPPARSPNSVVVSAALKSVLKVTPGDYDAITTANTLKDLESGTIPQSLKFSAPQILEKLKKSEMKFYTFKVFNSLDEDGDTVEIYIDGQVLGFVVLSHAGSSFSVPLEFGKSKIITVKAVRDGGVGGVTFGAELVNSSILLRNMEVDESEIIYLGYGK